MPGSKLTPVNQRPRTPEEDHPSPPSMPAGVGGTNEEQEDYIKRVMYESKMRMAAALPEIVDGLIYKAQNGSPTAAKLIMEILEGKRRFYKMAAEYAIKEEAITNEAYDGEIDDISKML